MSVTDSAPRSSLVARALVAAALCLPGCDKITGGDKEPAKSDDGAAKVADDEEAKKKTADDEDAKKKAAADEDAKKKAGAADEDAKKKALADEDAKKKALEDEAKKKAEEDAKKPVLLTDITIAPAGGMFGGSAGALKVDAKAKFNEAINTGTYVHMKALCKKDARVFADVAQVGLVDYSKQLHQFTAGETTALSGSIFTQGIDTAMTPCQFDFRLGAGYGGVSVPLATVCYDTAAKIGPCDPPIAAAAMSGSSLPIEVADLTVKADATYGGAPGISINEVLQINSALNDNAQLVIKSACTNGTQKLVDTQFPYLSAGPFKYEPGESLSRPVRMYWNPAFAFTEAPKVCDVTFMLRQQKTGSWTEYDETVVKRGCFKDEKVADGACDPAAPAAPADAPLTAASTTIDGVKLELVAPYGAGPNQFNLKVQYDVTIKTPVDGSGMIESNVTCKVGSTSRVEKMWFSGVELHYLDVGETTRMTGQGFGSEALAGNPKSCEVAFTVGNRMGAAPAAPIELGKFCLKKGKLKAGKC